MRRCKPQSAGARTQYAAPPSWSKSLRTGGFAQMQRPAPSPAWQCACMITYDVCRALRNRSTAGARASARSGRWRYAVDAAQTAAHLAELGYAEAEVAVLDPDHADAIISHKIARPSKGVPSSWNRTIKDEQPAAAPCSHHSNGRCRGVMGSKEPRYITVQAITIQAITAMAVWAITM